MRHPEHIRPAEHLRSTPETHGREMVRVSLERVREITDARERTLTSLREIIDGAFVHALEQKLAYEKAALVELLEHEAATLHERKRASLRLRSEYFTLTPLDIEML